MAWGLPRDPLGETRDKAGPKLACDKQGERSSNRWIVQ